MIIDNPWGYTLMLRAENAVEGVYYANEEFILHMVLFRGATLGDSLVNRIPTMQTISPNFFVPRTATLVNEEYGAFLDSSLFGATENPFNTPATEWKRRLEAARVVYDRTHPPRRSFLEEEPTKAKTNRLKHILEPAVN